jgi:hypothetical protein
MTAGEQDRQQITAVIEQYHRGFATLDAETPLRPGVPLREISRGLAHSSAAKVAAYTCGQVFNQRLGRSRRHLADSWFDETQQTSQNTKETRDGWRTSRHLQGQHDSIREEDKKQAAGEDGGARLPEVGGGLPGSRVRLRSAGRGGRHGPSISRGLTLRRAGGGPLDITLEVPAERESARRRPGFSRRGRVGRPLQRTRTSKRRYTPGRYLRAGRSGW